MLQLRTYQREAIDALYSYWSTEGGSPLIVLPTGAGKSLVIATLMQELIRDYPDMRILLATHVKELIMQGYQELVGIWPFAPAGLYSAGLNRRDAHAQILFCGIQTVAKRAAEIGHVDLVMVDEAHLVPRNAETNYGRFLADMRAINPDLRLCGLTATDYRLGEGRLTEGDGAMFDAVAYEKPVAELIDEGYLCRPVSKATDTGYDLSGVGKVGGDFKQNALQAAVDRSDVTARAVGEVMAYGENRKSWLVFCAGVEHAYHVRDALRDRGVSAETVAGETPAGERARILSDFKAGRVRAVTNNSVLTTGFNHPGVDLLAMMRPTLSAALYVQMTGRGLRNAPGKNNCLVLDFAGNIRRHGPIDAIEVREPGKGDGDAPVKECPECHELCHASVKVCTECGYEFPPSEEPKHEAKAADSPILSKSEPTPLRVTGRELHRHEKVGGTPSVRCEYWCGYTVHKEWLCPAHTGYAKSKADRWWAKHGGERPFPRSPEEWLARQGELLPTAEISVRPSGRYYEVCSYVVGEAGSSMDSGQVENSRLLDEEIPF